MNYLIDPTLSEVKKLKLDVDNSDDEVRGLLTEDGKLFVWDGMWQSHMGFENWANLKGVFYFYLYPKTEDASISFWNNRPTDEECRNYVKNHKLLSRLKWQDDDIITAQAA